MDTNISCWSTRWLWRTVAPAIKTWIKSTAWIDYRKVFDSVPLSWLLTVLEICKVSLTIINLLKITMSKWKTNLHLNYSERNILYENVEINSGIFQSDSLSSLLFCLVFAPLSYELNGKDKDINRRTENKSPVLHGWLEVI